jgi:hypothetical protein
MAEDLNVVTPSEWSTLAAFLEGWEEMPLCFENLLSIPGIRISQVPKYLSDVIKYLISLKCGSNVDRCLGCNPASLV